MRKFLIIALSLIGFGIFPYEASAKKVRPQTPRDIINLCKAVDGELSGFNGGAFGCVWVDSQGGLNGVNCTDNGCEQNGSIVDKKQASGNSGKTPNNKSGGVAKENEIAQSAWEKNDKKTTAMAITGPTGTKIVTFKVGVEPEGEYAGVKVLGPDGHHYQPWDPKLNALLVAGGYVTDKGVAQVYMSDKAMENQIALKSDKDVRDRIYKAWVANGKKGPLVFPPATGHVNNDALGTKKLNDHRNDKPQVSSTSSSVNTPPPAAAAGTASTTTVTTNPAVQGGAVRDHRKTGNAAGSVGGVTASGSGVTGKTGGGASGGAVGPGAGRNTQQR